MYSLYLIVLVALVNCVWSHDVSVGTPIGETVFNKTLENSPTVYRRNDNVTISTEDGKIISHILVTDLRVDKGGEARIVDGGIGEQNVTLELKSPSVFRGYYFHVEVNAVENGTNIDLHMNKTTTSFGETIKPTSLPANNTQVLDNEFYELPKINIPKSLVEDSEAKKGQFEMENEDGNKIKGTNQLVIPSEVATDLSNKTKMPSESAKDMS